MNTTDIRKMALQKALLKRGAKAGTPSGYRAGLSGQKIRSGGLGRGLGVGKGRGPIRRPKLAPFDRPTVGRQDRRW